MAYSKQAWRDYDDTKTENQNRDRGAVVTPERLNHMETGIANSAERAELEQTKQDITSQLAHTEQSLTKRVDNLVIPISPENVNVEVTDAQNSMLKAQTFKTIGKRFDDVEVDIASISGDYVVSLENIVENSDFSNGSSNWDQNQIKTVEGDVLITDYSAASGNLTTYVYQNATYDGPLYQSVKVMTPSEKCSRISLRSSAVGGAVIDEIINPEANTWYRLSGIYESPTRLTNLNFVFESDFDTRASHIKEPLAIQLNNHFKENEMPRLEEIEKLLKSRNYYFQGRRTFSTLNEKLLKNDSEIEKLATRVEDIPTNSTQGKKIILPNKTENITLFNGTNDAENWHFEPIGTSEGSIDNVTNVDKSRIPAEKNIPDSSVHPWLYNGSSIWDGLAGNIVKLSVDSGNEGVFHVPLQDEVKLGADEDIMLLIFVDNINGSSARFELNYFDQYPSLGSLRKANYNKVNEGGDIWKTMVLPYNIGGAATYPRFEGNAPNYPTVNGVGLRVTDVEGLTNIYVGGVFKVKNPLDKGILVIDFDDGFASTYDFFEYMKGKYGYNASVGIVGSWIETEEDRYLDKWQMIEMENNGWDMISHTWDHVPATHRGLQGNFDSIKKNYDWLGEHGCHRGRRFFCHPTNQTTTDSIYATSLFHDLVRGARNLTGQYPDTINQFEFPSEDWGGNWTEGMWRGMLERTQNMKVVRHVHAHGIVSENAWNPFPDDLVQFKQFIDIIGEYDIEVMSYSELWDNVINRAQ